MTTEISVRLANKPGTLADLGETLGAADINLEAVQGVSTDGTSVLRFLCEDVSAAQLALDAAGIEYTTREVVTIQALHEPGTLGDVARVMADAGINIDSVYVTGSGDVVLGVDDVQGAQEVAKGMAVMQ